jgi:hypothetical protein
LELNNPYVFLGKIKNMKSFDELILFITEEKNKHMRKLKRIRFMLYTTSVIMITASIITLENHQNMISILLFSSLFLTFPFFHILNKNNHINRYEILLKEIKNEELNRNRIKK